MNSKNLEKIGLSQNESKIYLALLEIGSSTADSIAQKAGIHRRTVYDNLEKLLSKGLISFVIKSNKKFFEAANPKILKKIIKEEKEKILKKNNILNSIMPELILAQELSKDKQEVKVFKGKEGIKTLLWDILRTGKTNYVIGAQSTDEFKTILKQFHKERIKLKIKDKMIFMKEDSKRAKTFTNKKYTQVKILKKENTSPIAINVYGDNVALLIRSRNPLGILIKNKETARGFKEYFEMLWSICNTV